MLKGKVALVTGAGRGMGRAVAEVLAAAGAKVTVNDLNPDACESLCKALNDAGYSAASSPGNVTSKADVGAMAGVTMERFGSLDILVNCAGVLAPTKFEDITEREWDAVLDVNLKGTFLCCQAVLPTMRAAGYGRIINFSSTAGKNVSTVGGAHYTAAKAGVLGLTRHLASETGKDGITVNAICPGLIDTEMVTETIDATRQQEYIEGFPIKRLGTAQEVAELVKFLVSDQAGYITGASLDINGGDLMV
jgi:NAD(P)-dependent dehydrogenase (short-subunit alcohol dehydrogenase family)